MNGMKERLLLATLVMVSSSAVSFADDSDWQHQTDGGSYSNNNGYSNSNGNSSGSSNSSGSEGGYVRQSWEVTKEAYRQTFGHGSQADQIADEVKNYDPNK